MLIEGYDIDGLTVERYEFDRLPPKPVHRAFCEWLSWHGIDPADVARPGWIERHADTRRIVYEAYQRDDDGYVLWTPKPVRAARTVHVVQLEAVPSPFPQPPFPLRRGEHPWSATRWPAG